MDEDILDWTREELIAEVMRLPTGIRGHRDSSGHDIIQSFGVFFPNQFRRILQSLPGPSSCAAASGIARHSSGSFPMLRARMRSSIMMKSNDVCSTQAPARIEEALGVN